MKNTRMRKIVAKREKHALPPSFEEIFTFEHLFHSYQECIKGVKWKNSTQKFRLNVMGNLLQIQNDLLNGVFRSKGFYEFDIVERGKPRHIRSVHISERIVQRCLCDYGLVPILSKSLIYDNGASLRGKGYDFSIKRIKHFLRSSSSSDYALLFDFSKYFDRIPHDKTMQILEKARFDAAALTLCRHFIDAFGDVGLGLGSQISQILAVAYLSELDHMIKEQLCIHKYVRYMDDGILISSSKEELHNALAAIRKKCEELGIVLNEKKTKIVRLSKPFKFLKIHFSYSQNGKLLLRPDYSKYRRQRKKILALQEKQVPFQDILTSTNSWAGHMKKFTNTRYTYQIKLLLNEVKRNYDQMDMS